MNEISVKDFKHNGTGITLDEFMNSTRKGMIVLGILEIGDNPKLRVKEIQKECERIVGYRPEDIWCFMHTTIDGLFIIARRIKPGSKMEIGLKTCGFSTPY